MMKSNQIYLGDCLELMDDIEDGSIDMILADLPYGTTACVWDTIIPFEPLWAHYRRVIKPNGAIVLTGSQPFTSMLVMSNLEWFKYEWIWDKRSPTNHLNVKIKPMSQHETVLMFSESWGEYNPQYRDDVNRPPQNNVRVSGKQNRVYGKAGDIRNFGVGYPKTILEFPRPTAGKLHPTQKPVALFAYLIRTYTNPGELVLDNVIGSGTTAIAAIETGRQWIGIEQDETYYNLAKDRIAERLKQPFLPGIVESQNGSEAKQASLLPDGAGD